MENLLFLGVPILKHITVIQITVQADCLTTLLKLATKGWFLAFPVSLGGTLQGYLFSAYWIAICNETNKKHWSITFDPNLKDRR